MSLKTQISNISKLEITTFKEEFISQSNKIDFIKGYKEDKCIAIYDEKMYPLIIAKNDENFVVIKICINEILNKIQKYILKICNNKITGIYDTNGKKVFIANENQELQIINISEKINPFYTIYISIIEKEKHTILYDILKNEVILKSLYNNSTFSIFNDYLLEKQDNKIKAIYNKNFNMIFSSKLGSFEIVESMYSSNTYIKELHENGKCHSIYQLNIFDYNIIYSNSDLDLDIKFLDFKHFAILGKVNNLCKHIYFYYYNNNFLKPESKINLEENEYLEITKHDLIKVMFKGKCIKVLNSYLDEICSLKYDNSIVPKTYFEVTNDFIKKYNKSNCIAIYSLNGTPYIFSNQNQNILVNTKNDICHPIFYIIENNKCIYITNRINSLQIESNTTYELWSAYDDKLIGGYIIKNNKKIGIFNSNLHIVASTEFSNNLSIEAIKYDIRLIPTEDIHGIEYPEEYLKLLYSIIDNDGKCRQIYDENNNLVLKTDKDNYFEVYENDYILLYNNDDLCYKVYCIKNFIVNNPLYIENQIISPYKSKNGTILFITFNIEQKVYTGIYKENNNNFIRLFERYENFYDYKDFLLIISIKSGKFTIIDFSNPNNRNNKMLYKLGNLILNASDKDNSYIYEEILNDNSDSNIISIYAFDKDGFNKIISSKNNIEPIYIDNNLFFKVGEEIYNKVGNLIL